MRNGILTLAGLGQQNDARMNVALALTAAQNGATLANHCEVLDLIKNEQGHIKGAKVRDNLTGDEWVIKAKVRFSVKRESNKELTTLLFRVLLMLLVHSLTACVKWTTKPTEKSLHHPLASILFFPTTIALETWAY